MSSAVHFTIDAFTNLLLYFQTNTAISYTTNTHFNSQFYLLIMCQTFSLDFYFRLL